MNKSRRSFTLLVSQSGITFWFCCLRARPILLFLHALSPYFAVWGIFSHSEWYSAKLSSMGGCHLCLWTWISTGVVEQGAFVVGTRFVPCRCVHFIWPAACCSCAVSINFWRNSNSFTHPNKWISTSWQFRDFVKTEKDTLTLEGTFGAVSSSPGTAFPLLSLSHFFAMNNSSHEQCGDVLFEEALVYLKGNVFHFCLWMSTMYPTWHQRGLTVSSLQPRKQSGLFLHMWICSF